MDESSSELPSYFPVVAATVRVFADDGELDLRELDHLLEVAMRDGTIDPAERRVLITVLGEVSRRPMSAEMQGRVQEVRAWLEALP